ncbi:phytoene/squalene synthase family protein [Oscillatoria amoena NRMC-F 0135]|nr:phytoene/squalene synthase family protein [Oscillatoria amoena NRMC-F 0135]
MNSSAQLCGPLLESVSRSFYLTLRILPRRLREPVSLAYLLARATDTIADTRIIPASDRRAALATLSQAIQSRAITSEATAISSSLVKHQAIEGERILLEKIGDCLALLSAQSPEDQALIARVLETICSGQDLDLARFDCGGGEGRQSPIHSLQTPDELDDYTYRVAGCVGEFWTEMCLLHLPACGKWDRAMSLERGIRFGKALQLTNILRDLPRDLRGGRCYLPLDEIQSVGLRPDDLIDPARYATLQPVYERWLQIAFAHYRQAWDYTLQYPRRLWRMRLACAWPVLIGVETLSRLRGAGVNPLDATGRIKISRGEVWSIMARSTLWVWSDTRFAGLCRV